MSENRPDKDRADGYDLAVEEARPKVKRPPLYRVHTKGKGVCGVFNYEIAETKVAQVMGIAKQHQHPLLCTMEES